MSPADVLGAVASVVAVSMIVVGVGLFVVAAVGLVRFPDPYTRLTAVTKSGTLGLVLVLLAVMIAAPGVQNGVKLAMAIVLQLLTAPVGGLSLSRGIFRSGARLPSDLLYDEMTDRRQDG